MGIKREETSERSLRRLETPWQRREANKVSRQVRRGDQGVREDERRWWRGIPPWEASRKARREKRARGRRVKRGRREGRKCCRLLFTTSRWPRREEIEARRRRMRRREAHSHPTLSLRREEWRKSRPACQERGVPGEADANVGAERARMRRRAGSNQTRWERLMTRQSRTYGEKCFTKCNESKVRKVRPCCDAAGTSWRMP